MLLTGRNSYYRTSTGDCCTGRHPRQVFLYPSDNSNPPQCPSSDLYLSSGHLEPSRLSWASTLFALRCSPLTDGAGQFSAWKMSWSPVPMIGLSVAVQRARLGLAVFFPRFALLASSYSFLAPEVAVCAFKALGPADPHLLFSGEVKLLAC